MDAAAGAGVFGDDEGAIGLSFDDGIADVGHVGNVLPVDLAIAAGALGAALDDVAGDGSGGEFIPIGRAPAEAVHHGGEGEGGVGGAAGDHDICAGRERFG